MFWNKLFKFFQQEYLKFCIYKFKGKYLNEYFITSIQNLITTLSHHKHQATYHSLRWETEPSWSWIFLANARPSATWKHGAVNNTTRADRSSAHPLSTGNACPLQLTLPTENNAELRLLLNRQDLPLGKSRSFCWVNGAAFKIKPFNRKSHI